MHYITGDIHGNYVDLREKVKKNNLTKDDVLIVLGDFCANYWLTLRDHGFKSKATRLGPTIFAIHGNHEERPESISTYKEKEWNGGIVFYEEEYPNILFAKDGEIYNIDGKDVFVCGGAYSVDKYYRAWRGLMLFPFHTDADIEKMQIIEDIVKGKKVSAGDKKKVDAYIDKLSSGIIYWWKNEQPSAETKAKCEAKLAERGWKVDVILTHTSPEKFEPKEMFLKNIDQNIVDKSTELWLNSIEEKTEYGMWYAGHYHTNKRVNEKFQFLFEDVVPFCKEKIIEHNIEER